MHLSNENPTIQELKVGYKSSRLDLPFKAVQSSTSTLGMRRVEKSQWDVQHLRLVFEVCSTAHSQKMSRREAFEGGRERVLLSWEAQMGMLYLNPCLN